MSRYPLPSDDHLERLIRESFEFTQGPDMPRLDQIGKRLARTALSQPGRQVNTLPWWIVLLLAGGFVAAAWWAADMLYPDSPGDKQMDSYESSIFGSDEAGRSEPVQEADQQQTQEYESSRESPIIYQRESL